MSTVQSTGVGPSLQNCGALKRVLLSSILRPCSIIALCLPLLAEEPPKKPIVGTPVGITDGTYDGETQSLQAELAYAKAQIEALRKQLQAELAACWNPDIMASRYEAAVAARKAEALRPEPKKK